jgi:hypothetical protein
MTYDINQDLTHTQNVIAVIWFSFIQNTLRGYTGVIFVIIT